MNIIQRHHLNLIWENFVTGFNQSEQTELLNIYKSDFLDFIEEKYGEFLREFILKEWQIIQKQELIESWEHEHGRSLGLIIINEFQRLELEEITEKLNAEIAVRQKKELKELELKSQLELKNKELERLSFLDGLTGIANRRFFKTVFNKEWNRSIRENSHISLIMLDIDYFKNFNDTLGHLRGDDCLKQISQVLKNSLKRSTDMASRFGGEEFAIVLPNLTTVEAMKLAQQIKSSIDQQRIEHPSSVISKYVTVSMGIATIVPTMNDQSETLVSAADHALYMAKNKGRNQIIIFDQPFR
jgi:diguanylate cyclase (GGDEF)-like protein